MAHRQVPAVNDCGREAQGQGGPSVCRSKAAPGCSGRRRGRGEGQRGSHYLKVPRAAGHHRSLDLLPRYVGCQEIDISIAVCCAVVLCVVSGGRR